MMESDMDKDVLISVTGAQTGGPNGEETELITKGRFSRQSGAYYITYDESSVTGMLGTTTTLKVDGGVIALVRHGCVNSQFLFEEGKKHLSYYDTPDGSYAVGIFTRKMDVDIDDRGGEITVGYAVDIENTRFGVSDFHMRIYEGGPGVPPSG